MDNTTRSYVSRFSGLLLFLLTLLVVGVLVILTVRAARDNDTSIGTDTESSQVAGDTSASANGEDFIIDGGDASNVDLSIDNGGAINPDQVEGDANAPAGVVVTPDEDRSTDTSDGSQDTASVAGASDEGESGEGDDEAMPTTVAVTGGSELPNTGAGETALGLILVGAMLYAFFGSRRDMIASLK